MEKNEENYKNNFISFKNHVMSFLEKEYTHYRKEVRENQMVKTKIIASIRKDYNREFLMSLINAGVRIFRINGAYFHFKEYKALVSQLKNIFQEINEIPTIMFDLKGPIPRISKLINGENRISVKKGQIIRIKEDNVRNIKDENLIYMDKNICSCLNIGDNLIIDGSKCVFNVISLETSKYLSNRIRLSEKNTFTYLSEKMLQRDIELEDRELFSIPEDIDLFIEKDLSKDFETNFFEGESFKVIKDKQNKIENDFQSLIKRTKKTCIQLNSNEFSYNNESLKLVKKKSSRERNYIKPKKIIICQVSENSEIYNNKKVCLDKKEIISELNLPIIGVKDVIDLHKSLKLDINILAALINHPSNIDEIKEIIGEQINVRIFSRIETYEAILNFDSILDKSDGIIINHGPLFSKISFDDLCLIELYMIRKCKILRKPIYLQTNILNSLVSRIKPSFNEISNIHISVDEGMDGFILKEEITMSHNYIHTINVLNEILLDYEPQTDTREKYEEISKFFKIYPKNFPLTLESLCDCTVKASFDMNTDAIFIISDNEIACKTLSKYRPNCTIYCFVSDVFSFNNLRIIRGIFPILIDKLNFDELEDDKIRTIAKKKIPNLNQDKKSNVIILKLYNKECSLTKTGMFFLEI